MFRCQKVEPSLLSLYDTIPMIVHVASEYRIEKIDRGLGGFLFQEQAVCPYDKDLGQYEKAVEFGRLFDISHWCFFLLFDGNTPIGGASVAAKSPEVHMLEGREELCVLWDLRVRDGYRRQGAGQMLFDSCTAWARNEGYLQMKIECQNNNVPACRFYHKQGAVLSAVNEYAYHGQEGISQEIQLIWYLNL